MKKLSIFVGIVLGILLFAACTFYPAVSQVEFEARQTAQAEATLPTVTPEPPMITVEPEVLPTEETGNVAEDPTPVPPAIMIKGNISSSGEKIYHMPGQANYNNVKIDEAKGERWFHSEQEALDAGWRKAKN